MKKLLFCLSCLLTATMTQSCSSELELNNVELPNNKDSVVVNFSFSNISTENSPWNVRTTSSQPIYHLSVYDPSKPDASLLNSGHVGVFTDLKYASIRLVRGKKYTVKATALKECSTKIDLEELGIITYSDAGNTYTDTINVLNTFSRYLHSYPSSSTFVYYGIAAESPTYTDMGIDRFYNSKDILPQSNERIDIHLHRLSYKIQVEIDAPKEGSICLSCDTPSFKYSVNTNDTHFSDSEIFSFGGFNFSTASKDIVVKLETFDSNGKSTFVEFKDINVKPNVRTTIYVKSDQEEAKNSFKLTLDDTPMKDEEFIWE